MFTDSHAHVLSEYYDDIELVLNEANKNGVNRVVNSAYDIKSSKEVLELIKKHNNMYGAIGIHPEEVDKYDESHIDFIKDNLSNNKVIAVGEIGLDYHYTKENKEKQTKLFKTFLKLAEDKNIPVIIHSRDATLDTINTLKEYKVKGIIHSFSGSLETAQEYIKMGFLIGINGVITFKNSNIKDVIKKIDLENIVLETDCPYLTPMPYRGKQNAPKYISDIAKFVADLYEIDIKDLEKITNENLLRIFDKLS